MTDTTMAGTGDFVVKLRGLPWSAKAEDILAFLQDCQVVGEASGVHLTYARGGRPSGEALVDLVSEKDLQRALCHNKENMGQRYIEVFEADESDVERVLNRPAQGYRRDMEEAIVKLRGLPFGCSKEEIAQFFTGLEIVPNGIMLPEDRQGRSTGEAFVQFASKQILERAMEKHKERIGHRYIEIFRSNMQEVMNYGSMPGIRPLMNMRLSPRAAPYDRGGRLPVNMAGPTFAGRGRKNGYEEEFNYGFSAGRGGGATSRMGGASGFGMGMGPQGGGMQREIGYVSRTGHSVHLRGLPYQAVEQDVMDFFAPLKPVYCELEYADDGRPNGKANADFSTHLQAMEAMKKDKSNMGSRYIELFLNSKPAPARRAPVSNDGSWDGSFGNGNLGGNFLGGNYSNDYQQQQARDFQQQARYSEAARYTGRSNQMIGAGDAYGGFGNQGYGKVGGYGEGLGRNSYQSF